MGVGAVVHVRSRRKQFTFAISSPDEFLFSDCRYKLVARNSPTTLCNGVQMAIFCALYFQRAACSTFSDLHSKFALRPHHAWKYGRGLDIQSATSENRRGKKKKKKDETTVAE